MKQIAIFSVAFILFILSGSMFIVSQTESVVILQFKDPVKVIDSPGLYFKRPFFLQEVIRYDKRILDHGAKTEELIASDQSRILVSAFAKYKIIDPLKFRVTVRTEQEFSNRLDTILDSRLREVIGTVSLKELLLEQRSRVMGNIRKNVNEEAKQFGVQIVDVRITRTDLPEGNTDAVFKRIRTERDREAQEYRAQGAEEKKRITSRAERDRAVLLADARMKAQLLRGEGDAKATQIFASAFNQDPEFYAFFRTMQSYRYALGKNDTTMVLSPNNEFLQFMRSNRATPIR